MEDTSHSQEEEYYLKRARETPPYLVVIAWSVDVYNESLMRA
jgi:hypothetical protein